ncbi:hypothetical protein NOR_00445 [Metarhizium rileyi]|uniref:Uncharacterized protein n=1 Tax=Metarhizium rileyi (strain RCEF 4871) TaxID=1649241 RepID=A0A167KKN8_METRR|nr:hypothetical protein NOR_00445 [Metarhizium rileyi RCEF 4871]
MKPTTTFAALLTLVAFGVGSPTPEEGIAVSVDPRTNVLAPRKGCSGQRVAGDKCSGRRLGPQNSFHNWYRLRFSGTVPSFVS